MMMMMMGSEIDVNSLYKKLVEMLRKFQESACEILLNSVHGIRLEEFQARLEVAAGMKFRCKEMGFERFVHFLGDCDFLEARALIKKDRKEMFMFIKEVWIGETHELVRRGILKYPGRVYREDTVVVDIKHVTLSTVKMVTVSSDELIISLPEEKFTEGDEGETKEEADRDHFEVNETIEEGPIVRIRRNTVFDDEERKGRDCRIAQVNLRHGSRSQWRENEKMTCSSSIPPPPPKSAKANGKEELANKEDCISNLCYLNSFTKFTWPRDSFKVRLLGCDYESYFYVRPVNNGSEESLKRLKSALKDLGASWTRKAESFSSVKKSQLKQGMIVLAIDRCTNLFCRALVLSIDEDVESENPVTYLDLDEGDEFVAGFSPTFIVPPDFRKPYFQAIKVGLHGHETYLGSEELREVFPKVPNLSQVLHCQLVVAGGDNKVPLVNLRYEAGESVIDFKSYM